MPPPEDEAGGESAATGPRAFRVGSAAALGTFRPDDILAQRFKIVRFLAQGGMGEVYEAEDLELGGRVALKTIRPEIATEPRIIQRFKREIALSRKVTHPNVCRIFDVFHHRMEWGTGEAELSFLAMELLHGETLASRLRAVRRMTSVEALPIVEQMAAGLAAAHHAGVVHRDFKSANVVLIRSEDDRQADGGVRAVVTDFGLARSVEGGEGLSTGLGMVGTSAYMAPEQVEGGEVTPAADVYALGVVLYEMVTGLKPFVGDTPLSTAVKRLKERPVSPRVHAPDLDAAWESVILRCLEPLPADRFASAEEVIHALKGDTAVRAGRRRRRGSVLALGVAGLAALAVLGSILVYRAGILGKTGKTRSTITATSPEGSVSARRSVALLGFKNLSGRSERAWLSVALAEMLSTELAAGENLRTIPGENVARMKIELALADAESLAADTLGRIRTNLGTDLVVLGSYLASGSQGDQKIRLDLRVQDAEKGETIASLTETGTEGELSELVSRTSGHLREKLGIGALTDAQAKAARAAMPKDPRAAQLYAEGLARLRHFDALKARDLLEKAVAADPSFSQGHAALAEAWSALGYDGKAKLAAQKAFDLSGNLSREDRLFVEARSHEASKEWEKAVEIYETLFGFFPDNLEYGLHLANAQVSAGKAKDAVGTIEKLRRLPEPASEDPRIDLAEASSSVILSDHRRVQALAEHAASLGARSGSELLVAAARIRQARAFWELGDAKTATTYYGEAREICERLGDTRCGAEALRGIGLIHWRSGQLTEARKVYETLVGLCRAMGYENGLAKALQDLGLVAGDLGEHETARELFKEALVHHVQVSDKGGIAVALHNTARTLVLLGDLKQGAEKHQEALVLFRELGSRDHEAMSLNNIAWILWLGGDLPGAQRTVNEAIAISKQVGQKAFLALHLLVLGNIMSDRDDLAAARAKYDESLALRTAIGQVGAAAEIRMVLALLALAEDRPADAELLVGQALNEFRKARLHDEEATGLAVLIRTLVVRGNVTDAQAALERARELLARTQNVNARFLLGLSIARLNAALGQTRIARNDLLAILDWAQRAGFYGRQLEARLALGEIEVRSGDTVIGRARLEALEVEATARGYALIARKARVARAASS
jgi:tetratricopeptide (TPR) repeat protein